MKKQFLLFGAPNIFHSDNGREFVDASMKKLVHDVLGQIQIIQDQPRHPQSQGMKQAYINVELKIAARMAKLSTNKSRWSTWLPQICCRRYLKSVFTKIDPTFFRNNI